MRPLLIAALVALVLPAVAQAETDPPVTTAWISPLLNSNGWTSADVTVSLSAEDAQGPSPPSGVAKIVTRLVRDGVETAEETPGSTATRVITAEGSTTIGYGAVDNDGNQEVFRTLVVRIDRTLPTVSMNAPPEGAEVPLGTRVGVSWVCEDTLSGLDNCFGPAEDQRDGIVDTSTPGRRSLIITATDRAGNQVTVQRNWTVVATSASVPNRPGAGGKPPTGFGQIVTLPAARSCIGTRIIFTLGRTAKVLRASFFVNGKRKRTVRGAKLRRPIALGSLPSGRFTVRVVFSMKDGRRYTGTRRYRRC